jgi:phosphotransferase system HPr (HPr) family protein
MLEHTVTVVNRLGLHARAAALLVRAASRFQSRILLERADRSASADAKSILSVLMLAASRGTELRVTAKGSDEAAALAAVRELFEGGFGEGEAEARAGEGERGSGS